jgi:hypothetical protein
VLAAQHLVGLVVRTRPGPQQREQLLLLFREVSGELVAQEVGRRPDRLGLEDHAAREAAQQRAELPVPVVLGREPLQRLLQEAWVRIVDQLRSGHGTAPFRSCGSP